MIVSIITNHAKLVGEITSPYHLFLTEIDCSKARVGITKLM